jgi:endonuclease G, mitochondrial
MMIQTKSPASYAPKSQPQAERNVASYEGREGYDPDFLGVRVELPKLDDSIKDMAVPMLDDPNDIELEYTHFSIVMHKERRSALLTAANIDGAQYQEIERDGKWVFDGRIDRKYQMGNEAYKDNDIDRGHMVRRRDPMWGPNAFQGQDDTFCYTNSALQHADLNQREWNDLENKILAGATEYPRKVSVFTGPVYSEKDPVFDNNGKMDVPTKMPQKFWKVQVWNEEGVGLKGEAYVMSQEHLYGKPKTGVEHVDVTDFSKYRVPLAQLEKMTKLDFDDGIQDDCKKTYKVA